MTTRPLVPSTAPALFGQEGELVLLRISAEPKLLEDLLETLAELDFPVNPQIYHRPALATVEFPAYSQRVEQVRTALRLSGFNPASLEVSGILTLVPGS